MLSVIVYKEKENCILIKNTHNKKKHIMFKKCPHLSLNMIVNVMLIPKNHSQEK